MSRVKALVIALTLVVAPILVVAAHDASPAVSQLSVTPRVFTHSLPQTVSVLNTVSQSSSTIAARSCIDRSTSQVVYSSLPAVTKAPQPTEQPYVKLPEKVTGKAGRFITIKAETNGENVWWYSPDAEVNLFPSELLKDSKTAVVIVEKNGTYRVCAYTALNGKSHPITICSVIVGDVSPGPDPKPDPKPDPVNPAPIPLAGLRVLIIEESSERVKLPLGQLAILTHQPMHDFLNTNCVAGPKMKEWRIWDKDVATGGVEKHWQDAMKRPRTSLPWIIVSNGTSGYEGPLPATIAETQALIGKYSSK